jgi:hypothetical protein
MACSRENFTAGIFDAPSLKNTFVYGGSKLCNGLVGVARKSVDNEHLPTGGVTFLMAWGHIQKR